MLQVAVVGAGPAGWYCAQALARRARVRLDLLERLPTPFGLVRFGVAPDHPEVKNVINTFNKTAQNPDVNFYGNITLGKDISLAQLKRNYHAVILAYGAEQDKELNIHNENIQNVLSARKFVGWYNGTPSDQDLKVDLSGSSVAVLGQGNVAMDVARILLTPIDELKKTDITENALATLVDSKIKNVHLIGRRGPLQAAFTIKELRELTKLSNCKTIWRDKDFVGINNVLENLPRPRKRMTELMLKNLADSNNVTTQPNTKRFLPIFFRSPKKILTANSGRLIGIELAVNQLVGDDYLTQTCSPTEQREILNCDTILRSVGYKSVQVDVDINFDTARGLVENSKGRVLSRARSGVDINGEMIEPGLYVTGWLGTGPTGVILTTMNNSFEVAANVANDINHPDNILNTDVPKEGFEGIKKILNKKNIQIVDWDGWKKIDEYEISSGEKCGKPREKISDIEKMLEICS